MVTWPEVPQGIQRRSPSGTPPTRRVAGVPMQKTWEPLWLVWGFGFCQWAFAAYAPFRPLFHVPLTTPLALRRCLRTFCTEVPSRPNFPSCSLGEAGDAGAELPQKLTITTNAAEPVLP